MPARRIAAASMTLLWAAACTPTPQAPGGGGGIDTACALPAGQGGPDLRVNCRITGTPPNRLIDTLNGNRSTCGPGTFTLFSQSVAADAVLIVGEGGDDTPARVRIGVRIAEGATHDGKLAKSAGDGCLEQIGPQVDVRTRFGGTHVALIDKQQTPMCVFQSRFLADPFTQTVSAGLEIDSAAVSRGPSVEAIERVLDFEAARSVNGLLRPNANTGGAFARRAGRCANDYRPFEG